MHNIYDVFRGQKQLHNSLRKLNWTLAHQHANHHEMSSDGVA